MTTYYFGPGGNDGNGGLSWSDRKATVSHAESIASANDVFYFGPGTYTASITITASGSSGQPITWIGDASGENTDGVGGAIVFDANGGDYNFLLGATRSFRTFKGIQFTGYVQYSLDAGPTVGTASSWIYEDCAFIQGNVGALKPYRATGDWVLRNCIFSGNDTTGVVYLIGTGSSWTILIESCVFLPQKGQVWNVRTSDVGTATVRNNFVWSAGDDGFTISTLSGGNAYVYNNIFILSREGAGAQDGAGHSGSGTGYIDNNIYWPQISRGGTWTVGKRERVAPPNAVMPLLFDTVMFPWAPLTMSGRFQGAFSGVEGTAPSADMWGISAQVSDKRQIGPTMFRQINYNNSEYPVGSASSVELPDNMSDIIIVEAMAGVQMTVSMQVKRETGYVGTNPGFVLRSPGVSDVTVTDSGSVNTWNSINGNITPTMGYVIVELQNLNTKKKHRSVFFSDIEITDAFT